MKILNLQFKNLNSLYGTWSIDFTDNTFIQDGLFLLCGPTGAGKSTILDAICLALYGQTPRLGKITQTSNEIMSKHTADCFALLQFEAKGVQFYARFDQRRARNTPHGKLQDVERSIAKDRPDNIIFRKKNEINEEIEKITGMDFQRFTRSVLLAQGAFDSFLKARDEEKSILLEQITGTEIYSEISKKVFERTKEEKEKTTALKIKSENCPLLTNEEIFLLQQEKEKISTEVQNTAIQLENLRHTLNWLTQKEELEQKFNLAKQHLESLLTEERQSQDKKNLLVQAENAEKILPIYNLCLLQENELKNFQNDFQKISEQLPEKEKRLAESTLQLTQINHEIQEQKIFFEKQKPFFEEIKKIDLILENSKQNLQKLQKEIKDKETNKQELEKISADNFKQKEQASLLLISLTNWLEQHKHFELLTSELSAIKQNLLALQDTVKIGQQLKEKIQLVDKELKLQKDKYSTEEKKYQLLIQNHKENQKKEQNYNHELEKLLQGKLLREWKTKLEHLQEKKFYLFKIANYEEQRKELINGKPCPLCGSLHHPFTIDKLPEQKNIEQEITETEKHIHSIEKVQQEQEKLQILLKQNQEQIVLFEQNLHIISEQIKEKEIYFQEVAEEKEKRLSEYHTQHQEIASKLSRFNLPEFNAKQIALILETLQNNLTEWNKKQKEKQNVEEKIQMIEKQEISIKTKQENLETILTQKYSAYKTEENSLKELEKQRTVQFGDKNPKIEEEKLTNKLNMIEIQKDTLSKNKEQYSSETEKDKATLKLLEKNITDKSIQLQNNYAEFEKQLAMQNFATKEAFLSAKMDNQERISLQEYYKKLEQDIHSTQNLIKNLQETAEKEAKKNLTHKSKTDCQKEEKETSQKQQELLLALGKLQEKLTENDKKQQENLTIKQELEKQQKIQEKWENLNLLIGSADGKKFRTLVQAITFEHVVQHANQKLQKLQKRYLLVRDTSEPLSLNIIDTYQGGEIRSVQNLSGGESFIISLSLALGLAQMSSKNVQVDSLFLDEGFGTLDEESLDTALSTLATIQQEGKLIGIISHISLLKERINTQITVIPTHGGKSLLTGAGCQKLA